MHKSHIMRNDTCYYSHVKNFSNNNNNNNIFCDRRI
jgi:hypothetical protein